MRRLRYLLEAAAAYMLFALFKILPIDAASGLGGWIGRTVGPRLGASRKALRNLEQALPETTPRERRRIVRGMWDNLGRVMAEYPHLDRIWDERPGGRIEMIGAEHVRALAAHEKGGIMFSGHLANWELAPVGARHQGVSLAVVYRTPNNLLIDRLLRRTRSAASVLVPKGAKGARDIMRILNGGGTVAMLVDQKMNDGLPIPFFGRPAMTATAVATLAYRFGCPVVPTRIERLGGARFRVTVFPPMDLPRGDDRAADVEALLIRINRMLEDWIRERPEQWLWLHRRWPNDP